MFRSLFRCFSTLVRTTEVIVGIILTFAAGVVEIADVYDIPLWVWLGCASVILFVLAVRLQWKLDDNNDTHMRRLRMKPVVSFGEIAKAISESDDAWSESEVMERLEGAFFQREFESYSGHPRTTIQQMDNSLNLLRARPLISVSDVTITETEDDTVGSNAFERALFQGISDDAVGGGMAYITLDRSDFERWYRKFRAGSYEQ